jgi:hypothetical protein
LPDLHFIRRSIFRQWATIHIYVIFLRQQRGHDDEGSSHHE